MPTSGQPPSRSFLWGPEWCLDLGVDFGGIHESARLCGLEPSAKNPLRIRTQNPHTQFENPRQNLCQKPAPKICTQNLHQSSHPKSTPKSAVKVSMNTGRAHKVHLLAARAGLQKVKKLTPKFPYTIQGDA